MSESFDRCTSILVGATDFDFKQGSSSGSAVEVSNCGVSASVLVALVNSTSLTSVYSTKSSFMIVSSSPSIVISELERSEDKIGPDVSGKLPLVPVVDN